MKRNGQELMEWDCINNCDIGNSVTSCDRLRLLPGIVQLHWQAFSKLVGDNLKARFESECKEDKEANPEASQSHKPRFKFLNEKIKEWYEEADTKKKKQVDDDETRNDLHAKTRVSTIQPSHILAFFTYIRLHKQNYPYPTIPGSSTLGPSTTGIRHAYTQISYTSPTQLHP